MVKWLLLLAVLAAFCFSTGAGSSVRDPYCHLATHSWAFDDFKKCKGSPFSIDAGKGTIDLSTWKDAELSQIFAAKPINGGFTIRNSLITGEKVLFNVGMSNPQANLTIENNLNLEQIFIETVPKYPAPYIRVSGNRKLNQDSILVLDELLTKGKIRNDSHIQAYHECDLGGATVQDVKTTLDGCSAIYGDLVFDGNSKFPADLATIEPLKYIQGCLRITGTNFKSWEEIAFLEKTKPLGGCTTGHEISGNTNMCIQPPLAHKLDLLFKGITISSNMNCTAECSNGYLQQTADSTCVIITDSLIIGAKTQLPALNNVEEIRGLLQVARTNITDFNYLPNLTKLNTQNYTSGAVIDLQGNIQLKTFDLPKLNASGLFLGRSGQLKYRSDKNGNFTANSALLKRIGVEDNSTLVFGSPTTTTAATTTVAITQAAISVVKVLETNKVLIIGVCVGAVVLCTLIGLAVGAYVAGFMFCPKRWKQRSMGKEEVEQTDLYQYSGQSDFHKEAKKMIEESKPKIEETNLRHQNNTSHRTPSLYNHMARGILPGPFQLEDYKKNKKVREARVESEKTSLLEYPVTIAVETTMKYPAEMDGLYGLAFQKKIGYDDKELKWRTQCDNFGTLWFKLGLPPIYPEYFASTAKKMRRKPCEMIGEKIAYMTDTRTRIPEFGITSQHFNPTNKAYSRCKEEPEDVFWFADQLPRFKIYRYRERLNKMRKVEGNKYVFSWSGNQYRFVERLVDTLMNLPTKELLDVEVTDVKHFLTIIRPSLFGESPMKTAFKRPPLPAGEYVAPLNKTHVRIVGETRGDFDALRRAINIPGKYPNDLHPFVEYNWVFLGNYTGRHPQSLETLMFLLAVQFLYGCDCIVLLRGVMEFEDTSEEYGFKENLMARFGRKRGIEVWGWIMEIVSKLPLNCQVLYGIYCSYGGFNEADILRKDKDAPLGKYHQKTTRQALAKIFSLPNVTVRDYLENADTGAGYYYGERVLQKIAASTHMYTFFSTAPMMGGVGFFSDSSAAQLITISSVRHLHGHGGQKSLLAAVAEIDGDTNLITMHMILHEDEMFHYDQETEELCYGLTKGEKPKESAAGASQETLVPSTTSKSTTKHSQENAAKPKGKAKPGAKAKIVSSSNSKTKTASAEV